MPKQLPDQFRLAPAMNLLEYRLVYLAGHSGLILLIAVTLALLGNILYVAQLSQTAATAPNSEIANSTKLSAGANSREEPEEVPAEPLLSVIIPAYNEANNIAACVQAVLQADHGSADRLQVWVVDDQSSDDTLAIAHQLQTQLQDPRLHILAGSPRPQEPQWMGKNWACVQGAEQTCSPYLLFLDADMRLQPGAIATALHYLQQNHLDLLSVCPANQCGSLAEWLVQPLVFGVLCVGFPFAAVNDPQQEAAFASGQFMLFRRSAYDQLGGHWAVADQVVEDVELARLAKQRGLHYRYVLGHQLATVRMYDSWASLWEGWTKNWYLGSGCNWRATVHLSVMVLLVCSLPWIGLLVFSTQAILQPGNWISALGAGITLVTILLQFRLRQIIQQLSAIPSRYWWLTGVGGGLMAAIAVGSLIKTETGWGWTWRGRSLKLPETTRKESTNPQQEA